MRRPLPKYRFGITAEALERESCIRVELRKNGNYLTDDAGDLGAACTPKCFVSLCFRNSPKNVRRSIFAPRAASVMLPPCLPRISFKKRCSISYTALVFHS